MSRFSVKEKTDIWTVIESREKAKLEEINKVLQEAGTELYQKAAEEQAKKQQAGAGKEEKKEEKGKGKEKVVDAEYKVEEEGKKGKAKK